MPEVRSSLSTIATDPLRNFKFHVNINHATRGGGGRNLIELGFMSLTGLSSTTESIPYRQGGYNTTTQKMPGQTDFPPITLARGVIKDTPQSWDWMREIFSVINGVGTGFGNPGANFRSNIEIKVMDHPVTSGAGVPVKLRVKVYNAWPTSFALSDLDAGGNAIMVEQLVLAHEGFEVTWGGAAPAAEAPRIS